MAGTLIITDGTVTVNLYDPSTLYLSRDGWRPGVGKENAAGDDYDDVTEVIKCEWMQTTDDTRDATLHNLNYLAAKARNNERQRKVTDQVYLSLNTPSETNVRYALIKDITVADLDSRHYGPSQPVELIITVLREGAWRKDSPLTYPQNYSSLASGTIYNKVDGASVNYIDVAAANVTGDALALPVVHVDTVTSPVAQEIIVALRSRLSATEVANFNPHFNAVNFTYASEAAYIVADASAPGGKKWMRTAGGATTYFNIMPLPAPLINYTGSFLVYAVVKSSTANMTMRIAHGIDAGFPTAPTPLVPIPQTIGNYSSVFLGRITMPASGPIPGITDPTNYYFYVEINTGGAGTFELRNFYLVPVEDGVVSIINRPNLYTDQIFVDSTLERSWYADDQYYQSVTSWAPSPKGRYLRLKPRYNHRLLFYFTTPDGFGGVNPAYSATVTLRATMRYLGLRGNT
jgi:hypothetical protein